MALRLTLEARQRVYGPATRSEAAQRDEGSSCISAHRSL
jgi:hypothetical protein